jgi:CRISPR-associated protein Csm1
MTYNPESTYLYSILKSIFHLHQFIKNDNSTNFIQFLSNTKLSKPIIDEISNLDPSLSSTFHSISKFVLPENTNTSQNQFILNNIFYSIKNNNSSKEFTFFNNHNFFTSSNINQPEHLYQQFLSELNLLFENSTNPLPIAENTLTLIQKYFSFYPSPKSNIVSFYNFTKVSSGFFNAVIQSDKNSVLLLGGDVSGIQSFIYTINNKLASRNLKGRSFYLQLLVDSIIHYILKNTNSFSSNIIYASGGSFFLILPDTQQIQDKLNSQIIPYIQQKIFEKHKTAFSIPIEFISFNPLNENSSSNTSEYWKQLTLKISEKKSKPFINILKDKYNYFFECAEPGGYSNIDDFSGEYLSDENTYTIDDSNNIVKYDKNKHSDEKDYLKLSQYNASIIKMASKLYNAKYILFYDLQDNQPPTDFKKFQVCDLVEIHITDKIDETSISNCQKIFIINPDPSHSLNINYKNIPQHFYFYGGNKYPKDENNNPKNFSDFANKKDSNFNKLGILRMDVDSLGSIFINGLPSFAHYSTLSYYLDFFFKYYLNKIWEKNYKDNSIIIYSGGDDLFIVGFWSEMIYLAHEIQQEFSAYTHQSLTVSAGISIVSPKFPILKAAEMAGEEEELAKKHFFNGKSKNSISFLQNPLSFTSVSNQQSEWQIVKELSDTIQSKLKNKKLPKSIIYKIYNYKQLKDGIHKNDNISKHQWKWLMAYDFARNKNKETEDLLKTIQQNSIENKNLNSEKYHYLDFLVFAARWAELENR